tara:strand:+ start:1979 stop:2521 length:543 start_codon:yes stop_codon:yes gene_type:complete
MAKNRNYTVGLKRKREGRTDYRKRMKYLKSPNPRLVIRTGLNSIRMQLIKFDPRGDRVISSIDSKELGKLGWKYHKGNVPSAYLTGLIMGVKEQGKEVVPDFGLKTPIKGSKLYAALKGVREGGLKINVDEKILPSDDQVSGKIIQEYSTKVDKKLQFSKNDPKDMVANFQEIKQKILKK